MLFKKSALLSKLVCLDFSIKQILSGSLSSLFGHFFCISVCLKNSFWRPPAPLHAYFSPVLAVVLEVNDHHVSVDKVGS